MEDCRVGRRAPRGGWDTGAGHAPYWVDGAQMSANIIYVHVWAGRLCRWRVPHLGRPKATWAGRLEGWGPTRRDASVEGWQTLVKGGRALLRALLRLGGNANLALLTAQWFAINGAITDIRQQTAPQAPTLTNNPTTPTPAPPTGGCSCGCVSGGVALVEFHQLITRVARERHQR